MTRRFHGARPSNSSLIASGLYSCRHVHISEARVSYSCRREKWQWSSSFEASADSRSFLQSAATCTYILQDQNGGILAWLFVAITRLSRHLPRTSRQVRPRLHVRV